MSHSSNDHALPHGCRQESAAEAGELLTPDQEAQLQAPTYDGYPYLITRLSPAVYHFLLLPKITQDSRLLQLAHCQVMFNRMPAFLVTNPVAGIHLDPATGKTYTGPIPRGGTKTHGKLQPLTPLEDTADNRARLARLAAYLKDQSGYVLGDLTKGGRDASPEEAWLLAGRNGDGVPTGLIRCSGCGEWRGECLDPNPVFAWKLMRAHCLCENDNRCARCGLLLGKRKLAANYFDPRDGQIWHVPGFTALDHRCPDECGDGRMGVNS